MASTHRKAKNSANKSVESLKTEVDYKAALMDWRHSNSSMVPDGYATTRGWAARWGLRKTRTQEIIREMIQDGTMKSSEGLVSTSDGRVMSVPHYGLARK